MKGFRLIHAVALIAGLLFLYVPIGILILYSFKRLAACHGLGRIFHAMVCEPAEQSGTEGCRASLARRGDGFRDHRDHPRHAGGFGPGARATGPREAAIRRVDCRAHGDAEVITGLSLLLLFVALNVERGAITVTLAHATLTLCFVTMIVQARLATLDRSLEEAAQDLGASPLRVTLTITLPLALPAIVAGWLLAFTLSLDDLVIASFATGPGATTLPMRIYSAVRLGVSPEINAISTLLIAAVAALVVTASLLLKREKLLAG